MRGMHQEVALPFRLDEAAERQHQFTTLDALADQLFSADRHAAVVQGHGHAQV
ncbi:hypothetical protein D3C86_2001020 [compost metagenome]